jgi:transposase
MAETRRKFDHDFRESAAHWSARPASRSRRWPVARDLGINEGTLGNWVNADKRRHGEGSAGRRTPWAISAAQRAQLAAKVRRRGCSVPSCPPGSRSRIHAAAARNYARLVPVPAGDVLSWAARPWRRARR